MTDTSRPSRTTGTAPREQVAERTNARLNSLLRPARIAGTIRTCQWIPGDPMHDPSMCGAPVLPGTAWCQTHYGVVFASGPARHVLTEHNVQYLKTAVVALGVESMSVDRSFDEAVP